VIQKGAAKAQRKKTSFAFDRSNPRMLFVRKKEKKREKRQRTKTEKKRKIQTHTSARKQRHKKGPLA